jgi:hypothetical protein
METFARTSHYISELLFAHDCVIVPSFGGFVCTYAPAKIHPAQHVFTPPSKQVFFNKHLQNNDGLLVNAIATAVPCSFEEALKDVRAFVSAIENLIKQGRKVELPHLGTLSVDPEGNISFENSHDVNFLVEAFGLSSFQSMPVLREGVIAEKKAEPVVRNINEEKEKESVAEPRFKVWRVAAFIGMPLLAVSLLFTLNTKLRGATLAGLGIANEEPSLYSPAVYFKKESPVTKEEVKPDANGNYLLALDENSPAMVVSIYKVAADTTRVEQITIDKPTVIPVDNSKYYVIGGAFSVPENAENYRKALVAKGYKPVILGNVKSKLTHIALSGFNTKEEAAAFLSVIKGDLPDAWILKQK